MSHECHVRGLRLNVEYHRQPPKHFELRYNNKNYVPKVFRSKWRIPYTESRDSKLLEGRYQVSPTLILQVQCMASRSIACICCTEEQLKMSVENLSRQKTMGFKLRH